jgi:hypothetical protein
MVYSKFRKLSDSRTIAIYSPRQTQAAFLLQNAQKEITMRKTVLTVLGASLIAALTVQVAAAAEHHHTRKVDRAPASAQFRNSNAYEAPATVAVQPDWSRYSGGMSAPAGR